MTNSIRLGWTVRDIVSGFTGIAIQSMEQLNGNLQIAIQPKIQEGSAVYPDAMFIDQHTIKKLDDGVVAHSTPAPEVCIKLGNRVRDKVTGFEGIATNKAIYMNGCVHFTVVPRLKEGTETLVNPDASVIDYLRLEVVGEGIANEIVRPPRDPKNQHPGGPAQRVVRAR